jgi:iron complex transport system substrate-binding protein
MIELLGAENIFAKEKGIVFPNNEEILARNPDVIMTNIDYVSGMLDEIKGRPGFILINAVKNDAVFLIDTNSSARPSHRIVFALRQMAEFIYPEYYETIKQN